MGFGRFVQEKYPIRRLCPVPLYAHPSHQILDTLRRGQQVLVSLDAVNRQFIFTMYGEVVTRKPMKGFQNGTRSFGDYLKLMAEEAHSIEQHRRSVWMLRNQID
jgi:hypothetical protein